MSKVTKAKNGSTAKPENQGTGKKENGAESKKLYDGKQVSRLPVGRKERVPLERRIPYE